MHIVTTTILLTTDLIRSYIISSPADCKIAQELLRLAPPSFFTDGKDLCSKVKDAQRFTAERSVATKESLKNCSQSPKIKIETAF